MLISGQWWSSFWQKRLAWPRRSVSVMISRLSIVCKWKKNKNFLFVYLNRCLHKLVKKSLVVQRHFQINCTILLPQQKQKKCNFARNAICVVNEETIKTTIYNEGNSSLMKRLRQSIADPLWPAHEKSHSLQNAYKAPSLPLWSGVGKTRHLAWSSHFHFDNPWILIQLYLNHKGCSSSDTPRFMSAMQHGP